jgi:hypothetical protein
MSLDTVVNFSKATVFHPVTLLAFLGYKAKEVNGWPQSSGLITTAYVFLGLYFTKWFSNRWRNGLIPLRRLNSETWKQEIVLVTGGAQGELHRGKKRGSAYILTIPLNSRHWQGDMRSIGEKGSKGCCY